VSRCFAPEGADFAFVTFAEEAHAKALCAEGGVVIATTTTTTTPTTTTPTTRAGDADDADGARKTVAPARIPRPALVQWRARARARHAEK
jgi:hypothetical protein